MSEKLLYLVLFDKRLKGKIKFSHTRHRVDPSVQAVSLQVTFQVIPGGRLPLVSTRPASLPHKRSPGRFHRLRWRTSNYSSLLIYRPWEDKNCLLRNCWLVVFVEWVNGLEIMSHSGGHLPFEAQVNFAVNYSSANRITVAVNNTLTPHTLPPGYVKFYDSASQ